jgi:hypothetical protein
MKFNQHLERLFSYILFRSTFILRAEEFVFTTDKFQMKIHNTI